MKTVKIRKGKSSNITYLFSRNQCLVPIETDEVHWQPHHHFLHSLSQFWKEVCTTLIMVKCTFHISNLKQGNFKYYRALSIMKKELKKQYARKQPPRGIPKKRCSENMQQIYGRTPMPKCDIALRHGSSPVNLLHIFSTTFLKNTSGRLFLYA